MNVKSLMTKLIFKFAKFKFVLAGIPVIITNSKGEILLGKRSETNSTYPGYWGLPGGIMDKGEKSYETAKREIKEELGVKIKIIKKSKNVYESLPTKECPTQYINVIYYAKIIGGLPKAKDETSEIRWFKPFEIKKMKLAYNHKEILKKEGIIK